MAYLGGPVEVVFALGLLERRAQFLDLFAQPANLVDGALLVLPLSPHRLGLLLEVGELAAQIGEPMLAGFVFLLVQSSLFDLELHHTTTHLVELRRHRVDLCANHGTRFVDEVDRLVGQETIADVAIREGRRGDQGVVLDADSVVHLIALSQTTQDRDRVFDCRGVDRDRLEAPLQGCVLLDVATMLVERRGADAVQLASSQHRFE